MKALIPISIAALLLAACGSEPTYSDYDESEYGDPYDEGEESAESAEFDEDQARSDAKQEAASEDYVGPCTMDCSGHDAGYAWAADGHDDYGTSSSVSFDEGQEAYEERVEELVEEKRQEFEEEGADSDYAY